MKYIFLVVMMVGICVNARSQAAINWDDVTVKDSAGAVMKTAVWMEMVNSGKYEFSMTQDQKFGFLRKYTPAEYNAKIAAMPMPPPTKYFTTGDKIAAFSAKDIKGNAYDITKLAGKVVVLNFWFINCPPCRMEIPSLNELITEYKNRKDVVFIGIALDPKASIEQFLSTNPFNYNIVDNGGYIAQKYGVGSYPTHVVIDKESKVTFHTSGLSVATVPWVKKSIDAALK